VPSSGWWWRGDAVGDVVGFPSLASASAEQGRLAACHLFGIPNHGGKAPLPIGIYSIPEISYVGKTEPELTEAMEGSVTVQSRPDHGTSFFVRLPTPGENVTA